MSPFPLGILAASGVNAEAGAFDLLETATLTSSASSVSFTNLANYSGYKHLQVRSITRGSNSDLWSAVFVRFNSDSGNNYADHLLRATDTNIFATAVTSRTNIGYETAGNAAVSGAYGSSVIDILDPFSSSKNTNFKCLWGRLPNGDDTIAFGSGVYLSTAALSTIDFTNTANFVAGTRFSLYGIKG